MLALVLCLCASVGALNWWVDPFQYFRVANQFSPRYYQAMHRFIVPGLLRNAAYDTLLVGSSIVENTRNSDISTICGGSSINAAMPAISASEQKLILKTALTRHSLRRVILVLDFNAFSGEPDSRQEVAGPLPRYLYDDQSLNDLPYLLSGDVTAKSIRILTGDASRDRFSINPDAPWWWGDRFTYTSNRVISSLKLDDLNAQFQQPPRELTAMQLSFATNILPVLRHWRDTEFDVVWPPYSILVWVDFAQRKQLDLTLQFKRYVWEMTKDLPNVHIVDMQDISSITHDLNNYKDLYHFSPAINLRLVQEACAPARVVNEANIQTVEGNIRKQERAVAQLIDDIIESGDDPKLRLGGGLLPRVASDAPFVGSSRTAQRP